MICDVSRHSRMTKRARISVIVILGLLLVIFVGLLPAFIKARSTSAVIPCLGNLQKIDVAKNQWALEHHKTEQDTPTWDDIRPYLPARWSNSIPVCPDGGAYTLGRVGESPTCSLGDKEPRHKLP